MLEHTQ